MSQYDYLVVGAGLSGAVFANAAKRAGKSVLVIDRRDHIAGNIYTEDVEGIQVQLFVRAPISAIKQCIHRAPQSIQ